MQETAVVFKVSVPVNFGDEKHNLKCMNRINWISTFPTISRGDIILNTSESGYMNDGVYFWDGTKVIEPCFDIDEYGSVPLDFKVFVEFGVYSWDSLDRNKYLFTDISKLNIVSTQQLEITHRQVNLNIWVYTVKYQGFYYEIVSETELAGNANVDYTEYLQIGEQFTILEPMNDYLDSITGYTFSKHSFRVFDFDNFIE